MSTRAAATLGVLLGLASILPACGNGGAASAGGDAGASAASTARTAPGKTSRAKRRVSLAAKRCRRQLGDLLDSIESLANTLAVGLDYDDYLATVNRVRAAYDEVPAERLSLACLGRVAGAAESALNSHIEAVNLWGDCLATSSCKTESVEPRLQRKWEAASERLAEARRGLRGLA